MNVTKSNRKSIIAKLQREGHNIASHSSTREVKAYLDQSGPVPEHKALASHGSAPPKKPKAAARGRKSSRGGDNRSFAEKLAIAEDWVAGGYKSEGAYTPGVLTNQLGGTQPDFRFNENEGLVAFSYNEMQKIEDGASDIFSVKRSIGQFTPKEAKTWSYDNGVTFHTDVRPIYPVFVPPSAKYKGDPNGKKALWEVTKFALDPKFHHMVSTGKKPSLKGKKNPLLVDTDKMLTIELKDILSGMGSKAPRTSNPHAEVTHWDRDEGSVWVRLYLQQYDYADIYLDKHGYEVATAADKLTHPRLARVAEDFVAPLMPASTKGKFRGTGFVLGHD